MIIYGPQHTDVSGTELRTKKHLISIIPWNVHHNPIRELVVPM